MFEYETLRLIWWVLIGTLLIGFAITDGFDMGVGALLTVIGKTDTQRRVMLNTIAPHWDGNQVWFVTAGGALFAAWPMVYAASFSGFYFVMMLVLAILWLRPLALDYRAKLDNARWRFYADLCITLSGGIPPLIFGVAFGNLLQGVPFKLSEFAMPSYHGSFWALLNPFALLCGLVGLSLFISQGSVWLQIKTTGVIYQRARSIAIISALITAVLFIIGGVFLPSIKGYLITSVIDGNAVSNPLSKTVVSESGLWLTRFSEQPALWWFPCLGVIFFLATSLAAWAKKDALAFVLSSLGTAMVVLTAGVTLFPFIMPSSLMPQHSLTVWDSTSSQLTLSIMTYVACVMVPIILAYTLWSYFKMFGRVDEQFVEDNSHSLY